MKPTKLQQNILDVPGHWHLALLGGRGYGKTWYIFFEIVRHLTTWGPDEAAILVSRRRASSLHQFADELMSFLRIAFPKRVAYNANERQIKIDNRVVVQLAHVESDQALSEVAQGKNFSLIICEEVGEGPDLRVLDKLWMSLRAQSSKGHPRRMIWAGNPGGVNSAALAARFGLNDGRQPLEPFEVNGQTWVWVGGGPRDNETLDEAYLAGFAQLKETDPLLYEAWFNGVFTTGQDAYFGGAWSPAENVVSAEHFEPGNFHKLFLAGDHGTAAPAVFYLMGKLAYDVELPGGRIASAGTVVLYDEHAEVSPENLNRGTYREAPNVGASVLHMARRNGIKWPRGVIDSACKQNHGQPVTLLEQYRVAGLNLKVGQKPRGATRVENIQVFRQHLAERRILVTDRCQYFASTIGLIPRDPNEPEMYLDVGTPDHGLDAAFYGWLEIHNSKQIQSGSFR